MQEEQASKVQQEKERKMKHYITSEVFDVVKHRSLRTRLSSVFLVHLLCL